MANAWIQHMQKYKGQGKSMGELRALYKNGSSGASKPKSKPKKSKKARKSRKVGQGRRKRYWPQKMAAGKKKPSKCQYYEVDVTEECPFDMVRKDYANSERSCCFPRGESKDERNNRRRKEKKSRKKAGIKGKVPPRLQAWNDFVRANRRDGESWKEAIQRLKGSEF